MYAIKCNGQYVKVTAGKPSLVLDLRKANIYASGEAENYINTQIAKKKRDLYTVVEIEEQEADVHKNKISEKANEDVLFQINKINKSYMNSSQRIKQTIIIAIVVVNGRVNLTQLDKVSYKVGQPTFI